MKNIYLLLVFLISSFTSQAQDEFDKFEDNEDVTTIIVSRSMFKLMSQFNSDSDPETQEYMDMIKNIDGLRVYITENQDIAGEMKDMATKYIKSSKLTELMRVKDKGANVKIYVKQGRDEDHVEELLMFVSDKEDEQTIVMSLRGDIDLNKVALLTEKMSLPTGGYLEIQ
jgi:hypothetical protein